MFSVIDYFATYNMSSTVSYRPLQELKPANVWEEMHLKLKVYFLLFENINVHGVW